MTSNKDRSEWDNLKEWERNCLLWPDLLDWGENNNIEIEKEKGTGDLGIVSIVLQTNIDSPISYHIIKEIVEGKPASEKVEKCDWIVAVNGKATTGMNESCELLKSIKDAGDIVCLTIRKPVNHLKTIKHWGKNIVELKMPSSNLSFNCFSHFYLKGHDKQGKVEDRILVFKRNESRRQEESNTSGTMQLRRGDELVLINNTSVNGKKLRDIHNLVTASAKSIVVLSIKKMLVGKEYLEYLRKYFSRSPCRIYWSHQHKSVDVRLEKTSDNEQAGSNQNLGFILSSSKKSKSSPQVFHIVTKVDDDTPAFLSGLCVGDRLMSVNGKDLTNLEKPEAAVLLKKQNYVLTFEVASPEGVRPDPSIRRKSFNKTRADQSHVPLRRQSSEQEGKSITSNSASKHDEELEGTHDSASSYSVNEWSDGVELAVNLSVVRGNEDTDMRKPLVNVTGEKRRSSFSRKNKRLASLITQESSNDAYSASDSELALQVNELCNDCIEEKRKRLPSDKLKWNVSKIRSSCFNSICIKIEDRDGDAKALADHLGFSPEDIRRIARKHAINGALAVEFLDIWGKRSIDHNNVGKLRKICIEELKRDDVREAIDEWVERKDNCHGCGAFISC